MKKKAKVHKIHSLFELQQLAKEDPNYDKLAKIAASNLGGPHGTLQEAMRWLWTNVNEVPELGEQGVVDEVNFCIDLV